MQANVQRLKEYQTKLIVFPRVPGKVKAGDSDAAATSVAAALPKGALLPLEKPTACVSVEPLTDELKQKAAYRSLRIEHTNARYRGIRSVRAAAKTAEADDGDKAKN
jgi:large subunit ribosomal protein L13e